MKIDKAGIIDEALKLLNEVGIDALSTRLLADRLGVKQPALYWHFRSKRALLDAMNDEMLRRGHPHRWLVKDEDWKDFLRDNARSFRRALLAYRDGARVHAGTEASPDDLANPEAHIRMLVEAGASPELAIEILVSISRYVVGCVLEEQADVADAVAREKKLDEAASTYPLTAKALNHYRGKGAEVFFESGLAFILDGIVVRLKSLQA
ncbi:MAG: TetR/AcrR family transcriptional regulator C-terminal domain-containing protein [Rhizobiaceae bacterium]|nr:TetR/AcrR family transcriptional regulator C-terminal domain-containing protein [Rhizobiaceae bacterium]